MGAAAYLKHRKKAQVLAKIKYHTDYPLKSTAAEKLEARIEERQVHGLAKSATKNKLIRYTNRKGKLKHRWVTEAAFNRLQNAKSTIRAFKEARGAQPNRSISV